MQDIKQFVVDYLTGRVDSKAFIEEMKKNPAIIEWLQSIIPDGKVRCVDIISEDGEIKRNMTIPYNIQESLNNIWTRLGSSPLGREINTQDEILKIMREAFPELNLKANNILEKKFDFLLDACPEYLDSVEISEAGILEQLMEELPETMPKGKRIKAFREKLKAMFYVEGQKYPRWIQSSEWPLSKTGKPTKFLRQKSKGEVSYYYFLDMDTKEEIEVMQAY